MVKKISNSDFQRRLLMAIYTNEMRTNVDGKSAHRHACGIAEEYFFFPLFLGANNFCLYVHFHFRYSRFDADAFVYVPIEIIVLLMALFCLLVNKQNYCW